MNTQQPSMWKRKCTTYKFFYTLVKLNLSTYEPTATPVEKFIRRHASRYDTSLIIHSAYNDSMR